MKNTINFFAFLGILFLNACSKKESTIAPVIVKPKPIEVPVVKAYLPDGWKALENYMGANRSNAVTFSIGEKIYVGLGYSAFSGFSDVALDFYEYTPASNKWKSIADFPGLPRANAIAFVIKDKAYVGLGTNYDRKNKSSLYNDFYEYDPTTNKWTKKDEFPGRVTDQPIYFTIGEKGYFGSGNIDPFSPFNSEEFWEYNPKADQWSIKASCPKPNRCRAFGFSVGGKGYFGGGEDDNVRKLNDFHEYDPVANMWTKKNDLTTTLSRANAFNIGDFGYVVGGITGPSRATNTIYKYDTKLDNWTLIGDLPAVDDSQKGRFYPACVGYKGKAYIGLGSYEIEGENRSDFYEYTVK